MSFLQTQAEFHQFYLAPSLNLSDHASFPNDLHSPPLKDVQYPDSLDWRSKGYVTEVTIDGIIITLLLHWKASSFLNSHNYLLT